VQAPSGHLLIAELKTLIPPPNSECEISYSLKLQKAAIRLSSVLKSLLAIDLCRKSTCISLQFSGICRVQQWEAKDTGALYQKYCAHALLCSAHTEIPCLDKDVLIKRQNDLSQVEKQTAETPGR